MSFSLDDIWNEPVQAPPPRAHTHSPIPIDVDDDDSLPGPSAAKRPRTKLFLSDSEDGSPKKPTTPRRGTTSNVNPDINALFDDLDGDDDAPQGLAPSLDLNALRRQAASRHVVRVPAPTPHEIMPSSSPPRDGDGDDDGDGGGKKEAGEKKRKVLPKLDEARLLGPDGFPVLVKQTKYFKPRGKGHEAADLNRLMQIYQFWTHKMYPRNHFGENVQRIEKLCHSRRMTVAMSVWKDESKGTIHGRKPTDDPLDIPSDEEQEDEERPRAAPARDSSMSAPSSPAAGRSQPNSPPPRPPSSASERTSGFSDDDIDIDALIQEDAERQTASFNRGPSPPLNDNTTNYRTNAKPAANPDDMDDDDDALWSSFNDASLFDDPSLTGGTASAATSVNSVRSEPMDDDEDEWQILREQEEEEQRARAKKEASAPTNVQKEVSAGELGSGPAEPGAPRHTGDEGWDEMYL
ncbi:hypothetical protein EIP91_003813 [Steccherinum ochraceum]|uniref:Chromosome segregation in meiosis protein n=1 Tax=Steccherinum ochraceum TaxID=92696 RepID=A0A4R0RD74_9APHY|nr:hypothetical protein EIP91_003813 [Steccherinum ochraceum]